MSLVRIKCFILQTESTQLVHIVTTGTANPTGCIFIWSNRQSTSIFPTNKYTIVSKALADSSSVDQISWNSCLWLVERKLKTFLLVQKMRRTDVPSRRPLNPGAGFRPPANVSELSSKVMRDAKKAGQLGVLVPQQPAVFANDYAAEPELVSRSRCLSQSMEHRFDNKTDISDHQHFADNRTDFDFGCPGGKRDESDRWVFSPTQTAQILRGCLVQGMKVLSRL